MDLTFTRARYSGYEGRAGGNVVLVTIGPSTTRGAEYVTVQSTLPGLTSSLRVDAPDGSTKYGADTRDLAMRKAAIILAGWARGVLGVDLDVNVIDNT